MSFQLTLRYSGPRGAKVDRERFDGLEPALDALERRLDELAGSARRSTIDLRYKQFEPVQQVAARAQIAGPGRLFPRVAGGIDIRGDGSMEAFTGRVKRELVELEDRESPLDGLRRVLGENQG